MIRIVAMDRWVCGLEVVGIACYSFPGVRWSMRVLRWVKQSLCSLSVLNVGWEDGEGEGAELLEGICWCYANRVSVWL